MFWNILLFIVAWFTSSMLYSFGVMQILITLFCAIPLTHRFKGMVNSRGAYKLCAITVTLWSTITTAIVLGVIAWGNRYVVVGMCVGFGMAFLLSLGKWGINTSNAQDYLKAYSRYYGPVHLDEAHRQLFGVGMYDNAGN